MYDIVRHPPGSTSAADAGSAPAERLMRVAPLDLRQQRFRTVFSGFDKTEVVAFLTEAADDYEHALREIDRLRQDLMRMEALLTEHREREANLRNTLLTAQRLADEIKDAAQNEAKLIVRRRRAAPTCCSRRRRCRLEEVERDINEMRLRRRGVEGSLEASIQALYHALEFIRDQDRPDEKGAKGPAPPAAAGRRGGTGSVAARSGRAARGGVKTAADDACDAARGPGHPAAGRTSAGGHAGRRRCSSGWRPRRSMARPTRP